MTRSFGSASPQTGTGMSRWSTMWLPITAGTVTAAGKFPACEQNVTRKIRGVATLGISVTRGKRQTLGDLRERVMKSLLE